jgi:hypothetical protein
MRAMNSEVTVKGRNWDREATMMLGVKLEQRVRWQLRTT